MKLNHANYYSSDRPHISASRVKDYLKDPYYYKLKHIDKQITFKPTASMELGSLVDAMLTDPKKAERYYIKPPRSRDKDPYAVNQKLYEDAELRANEVLRHPAWNNRKTKKKYQPILTGEFEGVPLCGMADRLDFHKDGKLSIIDVKSVTPTAITSPKKWFYYAMDFRYDIQFSMYKYLASSQYNIPEEDIECYHLAVTSKDGYATAKLFRFSPYSVDLAKADWQRAVIGIDKKKFPRHTYKSLDDAELCGLQSLES